MKHLQALILNITYFALLALWSCDVFTNNVIPISEDFVRVYNIDPDKSFVALSVGELSASQGYLIYGYQLVSSISAGALQVPYILHVDMEGEIVWDTLLNTWQYVDELSQKWVQIGDKYYFSYYQGSTKQYFIAEFHFDDYTVNSQFSFTEQFPASSGPVSFISLAKGPNNTLIYGYYDCLSSNSRYRINQINPDSWQVMWSSGFDNLNNRLAARYDDVCSSKAADILPVQLGYYTQKNGIDVVYAKITEVSEAETTLTDNEYSYAIHRYNASTGAFIDRTPYMGVHTMPGGDDLHNMEVAISSTTGVLNEDSLTLSTINFTAEESDIMISQVLLDLAGDSLIGRDNGFSTREYDYTNAVYLYNIERPSDGHPFLLYVGTTWSGQVLICVFDARPSFGGAPTIVSKKYFGYKLYYEVRDFITTSDGGFAICGYTLNAGRFQQLCLFKFSSEQLQDMLKRR